MSASPTAISIKINFEHPEAISTSKKDPTIVQVKARFSDFEPGWLDDLVLVYEEISKQKSKMALVVSPEKIEATTETASSVKQATVIVIIFNILTSQTLNELWNMVNGMQIYANLPMFNIFFPAYSTVALDQIIEIAGFDLIPLDLILEPDEN